MQLINGQKYRDTNGFVWLVTAGRRIAQDGETFALCVSNLGRCRAAAYFAVSSGHDYIKQPGLAALVAQVAQ